MHPQHELNRLAAHKSRLLDRIAVQRAHTLNYATRASRPLVAVDRLLSLWRGLAPVVKLAALPVTFFVFKTVAPRWAFVRSILRRLPPALAALRSQIMPSPAGHARPRSE